MRESRVASNVALSPSHSHRMAGQRQWRRGEFGFLPHHASPVRRPSPLRTNSDLDICVSYQQHPERVRCLTWRGGSTCTHHHQDFHEHVYQIKTCAPCKFPLFSSWGRHPETAARCLRCRLFPWCVLESNTQERHFQHEWKQITLPMRADRGESTGTAGTRHVPQYNMSRNRTTRMFEDF